MVMQQGTSDFVEISDDETSPGGAVTDDWQPEDEFLEMAEPTVADYGGEKILGTEFAKEWFPVIPDRPVVPLTKYWRDPNIPGLFIGERDYHR